jgi:hypothetical protein
VSEKKKIKEELKTAHIHVRQMCDKGLVQVEIEYTRGLVGECETYAVEAVAKKHVESVEKPYEKRKRSGLVTNLGLGGKGGSNMKCENTLPTTCRVSTRCGAMVGGRETIPRTWKDSGKRRRGWGKQQRTGMS